MDQGRPRNKLKIVIDTSIVAKWVIPGERWEKNARALAEDIVHRRVEAHAPSLILYELTSVISKAIRAGKMNLDDGVKSLHAIGSIGLIIDNIEWDELSEVLRIAESTKLTIYDSTYIYLARKIGCKLLTADIEVKNKGRPITEIITFNDF
ncbi:MAG: type II toxin-antitoxin system VapC family toxin [Nitrososphaerota archaeon]